MCDKEALNERILELEQELVETKEKLNDYREKYHAMLTCKCGVGA